MASLTNLTKSDFSIILPLTWKRSRKSITNGEIYIGDKCINDVEPKNRDIAMVFQNYALYPHMTVYENMAFGLKLRKIKKEDIEKRF